MQFNAKIENLFLIPSDNNRVSYMVLHVWNLKSNSSYWQNISIIYWYVFNNSQMYILTDKPLTQKTSLSAFLF